MIKPLAKIDIVEYNKLYFITYKEGKEVYIDTKNNRKYPKFGKIKKSEFINLILFKK